MDWLTATEALGLLGTQPQTLYANVSRGRIKARPDPADSRRSLYRGDDVRRLAQRAAGRRKQETVATQAMHWGEPVLSTAISTIDSGRLLYRGFDACELAETASLEDVAALLWQAPVELTGSGAVVIEPGVAAAFAALAARVAQPVSMARSPGLLAREAGLVLATLADALSGATNLGEPLHARLAQRWKRPEAADAIRRTLVLLADHELNASTFAARVTVSTGASLWAGALSGLAALSGPRHGFASRGIAALVADTQHDAAEEGLREWLGEGRYLPGMGHQLYPYGDPRCITLLTSFDASPSFRAYRIAAEALTGDMPNIDFALAALTDRFDLPPDAGLTLFALARSVGWLAHMMEQIASGEMIRPRARYVGSSASPLPPGERSARGAG